jgi:TolB-like protein/Flp pilus assembly protein TadD
VKRCPKCNRVETDEALKFCRVDGATLVSDSSSFVGETETAQFGASSDASEVHTSIPPHTTGANINPGTAPTAVLPAQLPSTTSELKKTKSRRTAIVVGLIAVVAMTVVATFAVKSYLSRNNARSIQSIAVMPFINDSGNHDADYLSDGITETLINGLSQVPGLSVKARSSVFRYKAKDYDPRSVAKDLGVEALVSGHMVQRGDVVTVSVELVDSQTENVLWGNRYERKLEELLSFQRDVARDISNRLKSRLSSAEEAKVAKSYTADPKAFELYLKGRYFSRQFTLDGFTRGVGAFNQAIAIDPNYALAYAGLSDAYFYASTIHLPPTEALPKVGEYAQKALAIDDSLAAAHHSVANYKANYERDNAGAKREFERAVELDPNDPSIYADYSQFLINTSSENEQAIILAQKAKQVDPQDSYSSYSLAQAFILAGRYDDGLRETETTIRLDDKNWWGYYWPGVAYSEKGMHSEAIAALQTAAGIDDSPLIRGVLACALERAGRRAEAQKVIDDLILASKNKFVSQTSIAMGYAGLGDVDKAFEWLNKALESHDEQIIWIYKHPMFATLRNDPRYQELLKRLNLAQ